ncbi:hypothetical protein JSO59_002405 [Riemerella anatipestifer]|uniref:hypothetical protein n=1 Tax=Riemerella anatipestifer TaxID=34085 RepID=UPI0030BCD381
MNKEKFSKIFLISIVIAIVLSFLYGRFIIAPKYEKYGKYTVGIFREFSAKKGGAYDVIFYYLDSKRERRGISNISGNSFDKSFVGKRFLVYYVPNSSLSEIYLDTPIPDSIKSAPAEGWKELPEWAKKEKN